MKKVLLFFALLLTINVLNAQYSIQPMIATKTIIQKNNLWNLLFINNTQSSVIGRFELILRDRNTGLEQITASTHIVTIEKGAKQFNSVLLAPIQYNFFADGFLIQNQDLIPIGSYTACYRFTDVNQKGIIYIEECIPFDVEPLSPPVLMYPLHNVEIPNQPAQFTWAPPSPINLFNQLKYDVFIVEVFEGQKIEEAVQQNIPIYAERDVPNNFINFKGSKLLFDKDKLYAWQVIAKDKSDYTSKSEVWEFRIREETLAEKVIRGTPYVKVQLSDPQLAIAPNGYLKLSYQNIQGDSKVFLNIYENNNLVLSNIEQPLSLGENSIKLNLKKYFDLNEKSIYTIKVVNSKQEHWVLNFQIKYFKD